MDNQYPFSISEEERARRRFAELEARGEQVTFEEVLADQKQRDYNDSHRAAAPLKQAEDAVLVDTTGKDFEESVALVASVIRGRLIRSLSAPRWCG